MFWFLAQSHVQTQTQTQAQTKDQTKDQALSQARDSHAQQGLLLQTNSRYTGLSLGSRRC